jgi:hypothetical protein
MEKQIKEYFKAIIKEYTKDIVYRHNSMWFIGGILVGISIGYSYGYTSRLSNKEETQIN